MAAAGVFCLIALCFISLLFANPRTEKEARIILVAFYIQISSERSIILRILRTKNKPCIRLICKVVINMIKN
jgi:hypothetical protein